MRYLTSICKNMEDPVWARKYLLGPRTYDKTGRLCVIQPFDWLMIKQIMTNHDDYSYNRLIMEYNDVMFGGNNNVPFLKIVSLKYRLYVV